MQIYHVQSICSGNLKLMHRSDFFYFVVLEVLAIFSTFQFQEFFLEMKYDPTICFLNLSDDSKFEPL